MSSSDSDVIPYNNLNNLNLAPKLKPGQKKQKRTFNLIRNAERQAKTRAINRLKKAVAKLKTLTVEPVEVLVLIQEQKTQKFKYMGFGNMLNKFVRGSALTDGRPQVFRRYKTFMPESRISPMKMTPEKYTYPFLQGKSKEIAKEQLTRLQDISVEKGNSTEITQSIPGPSSCTTSNASQIELNKRKRELFNTSTKGKAPKRKSTTKASGPKTSKRKTTPKRRKPLKVTPPQSEREDDEDQETEEDLVLLDLGEATGLVEEDGNFIALDNSTISLDSNAIIDIAENWENGNIPNIEDLEDMVDMNTNNESSTSKTSDYHLNDFVVVCFEVINKKEMTTKNYIGQIVEIINQDMVVQFTKDSGTKDYKVWPEIADISVVSRNQIVRQLNQPETVIMGRNFYMKFDW